MSAPQMVTNWMGVERRIEPVGHVMRDPLTELDRRVWQLLLEQGGYSTWDEVRHALGMTGAVRGPSPLVRLYNRCHAARRRVLVRHGERWAYGVTPQCDPLPPEPQPQRVLS
jgi:hypothetical protein